MDWKKLLAYISGSVDEDLILRNEYLVKSIKEECLSKRILFGEASLQRAVFQFETHFHEERPPSGQGQRDLVSFTRAEQRWRAHSLP